MRRKVARRPSGWPAGCSLWKSWNDDALSRRPASASALLTLLLGFATGMLAVTIAVGGFIGVPGMIYLLGATSLVVSATELVIAFVMGLGGTLLFAAHGLVDVCLYC